MSTGPKHSAAACPARVRHPRLSAGSVALALVIFGCMLPSDQTSKLRLAFTAVPVVYVGDTVQLAARAVTPPSAGVIRPTDLVFESGNPAALEVDSAGLAVGKAADTVTVTVRLRFADAPPAVAKVPVLATLQIDSVAPSNRSFYYGDTVTVYGVGLNPATTSLFIGNVAPQLLRFAFVPGSPSGPSSLTVVVPMVATPARITARRGEVSTTAAAQLDIVQHDTLEPNDSVPRSLGTLGLASVIRLPYLVLEGTAPGKPAARDWYTFVNTGTQDISFTLKSAGVTSVDELSLSVADTLDVTGNPVPQGWLESVAGTYCRGTVVGGTHGVLDSQVVAVAGLGPGTYHVMVSTTVPSTEARGYELRIESGYHSLFSNPVRHHSGNCNAPDFFWYGLGTIYLSDTLSIDNIGQVAWHPFEANFGSVRYIIQLSPATVGWLTAPMVTVLRANGQPIAEFSSYGQFLQCFADGQDYWVAVWSQGSVGGYNVTVSPVSSQPCTPPIRGSTP